MFAAGLGNITKDGSSRQGCKRELVVFELVDIFIRKEDEDLAA
jgi:hypothetical protein